ncbi:MAG: carbamoyltransferase C-terminal domain-containing protein [Solirubrobacteraceae bacterium]
MLRKVYARWGLHSFDSTLARARLDELGQLVRSGREAYVLGIGTGGHNSGAALVRVSADGTVELVCNEEEERYLALKHCTLYPRSSLEAVSLRMRALGVKAEDLAACVSSFDYPGALVTLALRPALEEAPTSMVRLMRERPDDVVGEDRDAVAKASEWIGEQLGLGEPMPVVMMRHHDNHAYFSYASSPFAGDGGQTMVIVLDGTGDDASMSLYDCREGRLELLRTQGVNTFDSLGSMYGILSSTQGGWPILSSEGRYMGAAAWGEADRLGNRYYRRLKHLLHFGADGEVNLNRKLANWTQAGFGEPYSQELVDILGDPVPLARMWDPDAVLDVEDVRHPEITRERVDKAAAVQMVFEDALVHIVDNLIRVTGGHRLVLTGGTALNCVANMRLLECFDERWYERHLGRGDTRLHLWVPPIPGDAGTPAGAAFAFAMQAGARPGSPLKHAFYCGQAATAATIEDAIRAEPAVGSLPLGDCAGQQGLAKVADLLAHVVGGGGVMGLYQGVSETGPRALGHRSILANPCDADTRRVLNERVKRRELIRPLAPMLTRAAAERFFELEQGASDDDYNAYNYMVLTARARSEALEVIPAVVHHDGTGRLQIVRPEADPFCHEYLLAMGRRIGVEVSVNTSLNVGAPIAHTPEQALATLKRARGMDGLLMIDRDLQARLVWLEDRTDACERLMGWLGEWVRETGFALPVGSLSL